MKASKGIAGILTALAIGAACVAPAIAADTDFPNRAITVIVPYTPGGSADTLARLISERVSAKLGQPVVVQNKPGASQLIGIQAVSKAKPDGYTILLSASTITTLAAFKEEYRTALNSELAPLSESVNGSLLMAVPPDLKISSVKELVEYTKANPTAIKFGSTGIGSSVHLAVEYFMARTGAKMVHVPYPGSSAELTSLLQGSIQLMADPVFFLRPYAVDKKIVALAVTGGERSPTMPDVPTVAESGYPGFDVKPWIGFLITAGVPAPVMAKLSDAFTAAVKDPEMNKKIAEMGFVPVGSTPEQFGARLKTELETWTKVIKDQNLQLN